MDRQNERNGTKRAAGTAGSSWDVEQEVLSRYADAAAEREEALCCPTEGYDRELLAMIPEEIVAKDYGCGDPTRWVRSGERVVDLGSGAGKACYMLAQRVGPDGAVIGVDFNEAMLEVARRWQPEIADRIGYDNVRFIKAKIQDMRLDLDRLAAWLVENPVSTLDDLATLERRRNEWRTGEPAIPTGSVDVVVSNCVLNLVRTEEKRQLFEEIARILRRGGRAVISDIVCDEEPTDAIRNDPELWSGCIAGALTEERFLAMFAEAGFYGVEILARSREPWRTVDGIEFRSITVRAFVGTEGPCLEKNQAVVYRGPWSRVRDDDGHTLYRGERMAVCEKTYGLLTDPEGPYAGEVIGIEPRDPVSDDNALPFDCRSSARRHPRVTKGEEYDETSEGSGEVCGPDGCC